MNFFERKARAGMSPGQDDLVERMARAFCEAGGPYKWEDTHGLLREWYLRGARAALAVVQPEEAEDDKDKGWR